MAKIEFEVSAGSMVQWQEKMLCRAEIPGFFTPTVVKVNNQKKLVYDTKSFGTLRSYLASNGDRESRLKFFQQILMDCIGLEEEFLLPVSSVYLDAGHIYVDRYGGQSRLLCVPGNGSEVGFLASELLEGIWKNNQEPPASLEAWLEYTREMIISQSRMTDMIIKPQKQCKNIEERVEGTDWKGFPGEILKYRIFDDFRFMTVFLTLMFLLGILFGLFS